MTNYRKKFLDDLSRRVGQIRGLPASQSLYQIGDDIARVYIRYSKIHNPDRAFYGLREIDLRELEGHPAFICLLWDGQEEPLIIPYEDFADVFKTTHPAHDGQYKVQLFLEDTGSELYIAQAGRFNVDAYVGWEPITRAIMPSAPEVSPTLGHTQIQTLLGTLGVAQHYDVWIPMNNRDSLDWNLCPRFSCRDVFPSGYGQIEQILREIDVLWIERGGNALRAVYEVEHSTPIYSGLLRFNDVYLTYPTIDKFAIVASDIRRSAFARQLNRPTFSASGLSKICAFLEYKDVFQWYKRIQRLAAN